MRSTAAPRAYDHRIRDLVCASGDISLFSDLGIPRSTLRSWLRRGKRPVVSASVLDEDEQQLHLEVLRLRRRVAILTTVVRLLMLLVRFSGFRLDEQRFPSGVDKARILDAIDRASAVLPLRAVLRVLRLSSSRYHTWRRREETCRLDDQSTCPRSSPSQLTAAEVATMHEMVTAQEHRHMPVRTLALYAQRIGKLFAAPATWGRIIRERGWRRPRRRVHPSPPKLGIRATKPNELFHIDVTIIKLLDGTRAYLHGVIDNYSRKILSWKLATRLEPGATCEVLIQAAGFLPSESEPATVLADSGVENVNSQVDELLNLGVLRRVLAQVEIAFSNSMIEAWWRSLKHNHLFLHHLDSLTTLERLVAFYVDEHNTKMPHGAFNGQTPDEVYFGRGADVPDELAAARTRARKQRMETNRNLACGDCRASPDEDDPIRPLPHDQEIAA